MVGHHGLAHRFFRGPPKVVHRGCTMKIPPVSNGVVLLASSTSPAHLQSAEYDRGVLDLGMQCGGFSRSVANFRRNVKGFASFIGPRRLLRGYETMLAHLRSAGESIGWFSGADPTEDRPGPLVAALPR